MISFEQIQAAYYMLAATGVLIAAAYYVMTLKSSSKAQQMALKSRNAQFFVQLNSSIQDEEMLRISWNDMIGRRDWNTFEEWWEKHGPESDIAYFAKWLRSVILYETFGVLVKRGFLDINLVDDMISGPTLMEWEVYKPIIMGIREKYGYPQFQEYQEYLANEIRKIVDKQHPNYRGKRSTSKTSIFFSLTLYSVQYHLFQVNCMVSFEEIQTAYYMVAATGVLDTTIHYLFNFRARLQRIMK